MLTLLWILFSAAALTGSSLLLKSSAPMLPRLTSAAGCALPLLANILDTLLGTQSTWTILLMPLGLILCAAGGLWFTTLPRPWPEAKRILGAVLTAIVMLSAAGWILFAYTRTAALAS